MQGKDEATAERILNDARLLENAGADMLVLECVPSSLGATISEQLRIPVVGIGAGPDTDAQVLVVYDMLGISPRSPRFSKTFLAETGDIQKALEAYREAVRSQTFPAPEHCFK